MRKNTGAPAQAITTGTITAIALLALLPLSSRAGQADSDAADASATEAAATPGAGAPSEALTEVQVTGTRIVRQGYEAPTPVTAVGLADLQDANTPNIGNALNELPVFQGTTTVANTSSSDNEGAQTLLNLRNLTSSRTLVLFDGRRLPTANQENAPDVGLVPEALVQRVDVVTGGASAVYGSDAVAGVVNYVLNTNFTGIKGTVQVGTSGYGDGDSDKISLTGGTTFFDGKLHVLVSGEQGYSEQIKGTSRPWDVTGESAFQNPAYATNKNAPEYLKGQCCVSTPGLYPGGVILNGPLQGTDFGAGGAVGQYQNGYGLTTAGTYDMGGDWQESAFQGAASILASVAAQHYFARAAFDITPDMQVYAEWLDGADHTIDQCCYDYYQTGVGTLYTSNPYLPASVAATAAADSVTSFTLGDTLRFPAQANGSGNGVNGGLGVDDYRYTDVYVVGLKGNLNIGKNAYNWNLYGQMGINIEDFHIDQESIKVNLSDAIEAVTVGSYGGNTATTSPAVLGGLTTQAAYTAANFPNPLAIPKGTITCASNLLPRNSPNATSNCVPFNVFGTNVVSQAAINYTQAIGELREIGHQNIVGGSITGEPFSTWAGPVSVALDAEYRHEANGGTSDAISQQTGYFSTNFFPYFGSQYVTEGALETVIPILKSLPGVQELDLNGGARATDYSTSGYVTTFKYGLEYTPINDIRVRAVASEDIRAPSLFNLFGYSNGHGTTTDPFANNTNVPSYGITGGNPNLKPEKAHQYELGVVFQPSEVPGLNVSVDYFHIKIDSAIGSLSAVYELQQCYNTRIAGTFTGTSPLCNLIVRNPDGSLYSTEVIPFNIASFLTEGVDYSADYRKDLAQLASSWKGTADIRIAATNTIHNITNTGIPGANEITDAAGTGSVPRWAVLGTLTYTLDPWRFTWTERYDSSVIQAPTDITCAAPNCPNPLPSGFSTFAYVPRVPTYFLASVTATYKFMEHDQKEAEVFVNINNVFNKIPPWGAGAPGQLFAQPTNTTLYDTVGLYARVGVRFAL